MDHKIFVGEGEEGTRFVQVVERKGGGYDVEYSAWLFDDGSMLFDDFGFTWGFPSIENAAKLGYHVGDKQDETMFLMMQFCQKQGIEAIDDLPPMNNPFHTCGIFPRVS